MKMINRYQSISLLHQVVIQNDKEIMIDNYLFVKFENVESHYAFLKIIGY